MGVTPKQEHNQAISRVWEAYRSGNPVRVPVHFNLDERFFVLTPEINRAGITWKELFTDPEKVILHRLQVQRWWRDIEIPFMDVEFPESEPEAWEGCTPYFESAHEAAAFGCAFWFADGQNPDVCPLFQDDKTRLCSSVLPDSDPLGNNVIGESYRQMLRVRESSKGMVWEGKPIKPPSFPWRWFTGDGPFTVGVKLRGGTELCTDIYEDPAYVHELLDFITNSVIHRWKTLQSFAKKEMPDFEFKANFGIVSEYWGFSDDSAGMLSDQAYREFVLPYNKRIKDAFCSAEEPVHIHMCGQAQHLFETMVSELHARSFDVGYPTDMARMRKILGPDVTLMGNIHPMILRDGPVSRIEEAVREVLTSGVMAGGRFVLRDGSNVPPGTPVEHLRACYRTAKEYGRYV
ncbi:MAG: uroporphyrinogen decarboxylase family protein [Candidatus Latescibacterota bacterium]